jgi:hypothetical protein
MEYFREKDGLTFTEEGHRYELNGQWVISLTQIIAAAGLIDYSAVNPQVVEDKAKFGKKIHKYCLWLSKGDLDMDDLKPYPKYWNRVEGWRQFIEDFKFKFDLDWCEVPCAVKVNGILYAMTIDCYGSFGEGDNLALAVVEIKTCADQEPSHAIQTAGQAIAFHNHAETVHLPLKRFAVYLQDKPDAGGRYYKVQEHTERIDEKIFLSALVLTQWRINHKLL